MGPTIPLGRAPDTLEWAEQFPWGCYQPLRMGPTIPLGRAPDTLEWTRQRPCEVLSTRSNGPNDASWTRTRYARMDLAAPL
jgi:ribosomal protein L24E